ncbi:MAG: alpha/beta hydrolase [Candidatus Buchananbacteria bacterium]
MANKNCVIIHGCPSSPKTTINLKARYYNHWIAWTKNQLIANNIPTEAPMMPKPWSPVYEKFKAKFEQSDINKNTILIGHSCGGAFLVRWLGETKRKIFKLILVAPWIINDQDETFREAFYTFSIDKMIKERVEKIIMFTSDNEEDTGKKSLKILHDALGGKIIELKNHGHYTMGDMKTTEFPELIKEILS